MQLKQRLAGATVVAGLGDNHATGVGCGLEEKDFHTLVVSAGTSGTINRVCPPRARLAGNAACFEYYRNRLLLMMLADCCKWYDRFVAHDAAAYASRLDHLNGQIDKADLRGLRRVLHQQGKEIYPPGWKTLSLGQQAASTQLSIMVELLLLVRSMQAEVVDAKQRVRDFVLTGGLSQSQFFRQAFHVGVRLLDPKAKVLMSARQGPLRYQTAAYGALLNAMRPEDPLAARTLCPVKPVKRPSPQLQEHLSYLLQACGI
jgi:sugar (pentulose or hexulose) kinase